MNNRILDPRALRRRLRRLYNDLEYGDLDVASIRDDDVMRLKAALDGILSYDWIKEQTNREIGKQCPKTKPKTARAKCPTS